MMITSSLLWTEAQQMTLGCALLENEAAAKVVAKTRPEEYTGQFLPVYEAMKSCLAVGETLDFVSICGKIGDGSIELLRQLMMITPSSRNVDQYIENLHIQARGERLAELARQLTEEQDYSLRRELLARMHREDQSLEQGKNWGLDFLDAEFIENNWRQVDYLPWTPEGFGGQLYVEPGDLVVIGGYPSAGKSAFALQNAALWSRERRVGFYSLETSRQKIYHRLLAQVMDVRLQELKEGVHNRESQEKLSRRKEVLGALQLEVVEAAGMTVADILANARSRGHQVVVIDYLQLINGKGSSRYEQVTNISRDLQLMARTTGITVVALSQLRRSDQGHTSPSMSDLRESGQIEQDADLIMLLYRADPKGLSQDRVLRVAKNKEGTCPTIELGFDGEHQRFSRQQARIAAQYAADGRAARQRLRQLTT